MYGFRTNSTADDVQLSLYEADGTQCGTTTSVATSDDNWTQTNLGGDETACTFAAGDEILFNVKVTVDASDTVRAGAISFSYD